MLRGILGVLAGVVTGSLVVFGAEFAGHALYPPPAGVDFNDPAALRTLMDVIPLGAKVSVLVAWALGIFVGSAIAVVVAQRQSWPAWHTALILFGFALVTMVQIPHPDWMVLGATALTLASAISAAYIWARS
jgi:hypothetical protein